MSALFFVNDAASQAKINFTVGMEKPAEHQFQVRMELSGIKTDELLLKMPAWSPGYYQYMSYAKNLSAFNASGKGGKKLKWTQSSDNSWLIQSKNESSIVVTYSITASRAFVANAFLDETHAYIIPAALFLYPASALNQPVNIDIKPGQWKQIATGLSQVAGKSFRFTAPDYDVLYDSPLLIGNLDSIPGFSVHGVPHRFIGYQLGNFNKAQLSEDLQKVTTAAADIIGDIPFKQYTFIGIGPGQGGIEHLNSTTISFHYDAEPSTESRIRTLNFIAHEYFHHYNVKRIRPFELGPFDYDKGSKTNLLWIAEGLTVYYEYLTVKRAGLSSEKNLFDALEANILNYEGKPGRLYQSLTQSSYETWSDGPFGRTGDEVNKTISYYDKGPIVGLLLDFTIRHHTDNKRSLDDVMRLLYRQYYQQLKRGFTEAEFQTACEEMAGVPLTTLFEYTNTTKELDYPTYLAYAGLNIDTVLKEIPGAYTGLRTRNRKDSMYITQVDWNSPAWQANIRAGQIIVRINDQPATAGRLEQALKEMQAGDSLKLDLLDKGVTSRQIIRTGIKKEASYTISRMEKPDQLQARILADWLR